MLLVELKWEAKVKTKGGFCVVANDLITVKSKGDFRNTEKFLKRMKDRAYLSDLNEFGMMGVKALSSVTPRATGKTADSWGYTIENTPDTVTITWFNSNVQNGVNIAVILDKGHATKDGYWVQGLNYVDQALQPVFDKIAKKAWEGVIN